MGIREAEININGITLIGGDNKNGKSSIARAAGLILTGETTPLWLMKKDAPDLVNDQSKKGFVSLSTDDGTKKLEFPSMRSSVDGSNHPQSSLIAAGMKSIVYMDAKERSVYLSELLKTEPTEQEFNDALKKSKISKNEREAVWGRISEIGWDESYKKAREKATMMKGAWQHETGEKFGSEKAQGWTPAGWQQSYLKLDVDAIQKEIEALYKERASAEVAVVLEEQELADLTDLANNIEKAKDIYTENEKIKIKIESQLKELWRTVPPILSDESTPCPHCKKPVIVQGKSVVAATSVKKADIAASQKLFDDHQEKIAEVEKRLKNASDDVMKSKAIYTECIEAKAKIAKLSGKSKASRPKEDIDKDIVSKKALIDSIKTYVEATKINGNIQNLLEVIDILAPEGLRAKALKRGIGMFNEMLENICKKARWEQVSLLEDMSVTFDGRSYHLLSDSEKYRVMVTLQVAISDIDNSSVVIVDGADILNKNGRNGLVNILKGRPSLICLTLKDKDELPDLSKLGGNSYWVENGEIV